MTNEQIILIELKKGRRLSKAQAVHELGIYSFTQRIHDLIKKGYNIQSIKVHHVNKQGHNASYSEYFLES